MAGGDESAPAGGARGSDGRARRWGLPVAVVVAWVAGILLIDDETAQTIFVVGLVVALVGGDEILSRRRGEKTGPSADDPAFPVVPLILAVLAASFFSSADAERAALVPLAVAFVAIWKLIRRRRHGAAPDPL